MESLFVKPAQDCPKCQRTATIHQQPTWIERVLKGVRLEKVHLTMVLLLVYAIVFVTLAVEKLVPLNDSWDDWVLLTLLTPAAIGLATFYSWVLIWAPSWYRRFVIDWRLDKFVDGQDIHTHLYGDGLDMDGMYEGHQVGLVLETSKFGLTSRAYFPFGPPANLPIQEWWFPSFRRHGHITFGDDEMTVPVDLGLAIMTQFQSRSRFLHSAELFSPATALVQTLGVSMVDQAGAIMSDPKRLGNSPHGQAMRDWLLHQIRRYRGAFAQIHPEYVLNPFDLAEKQAEKLRAKIKARNKRQVRSTPTEATLSK